SNLQVGQRLELECETNKDDSGVFWVRLDKHGTLHFIVFISSLARVTFEGNKQSTRFEAKKESRFFRLVVKSFMPQDEGTYFCLVNSNQILYFSPGQPVFLPGQQHLHPILLSSAKISSSPCPCFSLIKTSKEEEMNFYCNIVIWVPLAGACVLLLMALAVTIILCQRTRRRRCRCKR
ncbi:CD8A protein, partial [Anhinga rufa]|nr:CD8A protein [Anhinga rufa]